MPSDLNVGLGYYIILIPPHPNASTTTVTLKIQEVEAQDDSMDRALRRLSEAGVQRHEAQRHLTDSEVDGLGMPMLPRGFMG